MKFMLDIKADRLPLIKASARKMMLAKGKITVKPVFKEIPIEPLTKEEKAYCGI